MSNRILYTPKERKSFKPRMRTLSLGVAIGGGIVCIIIAAGIMSTRLDVLAIHNISVSGTRSLSPEDIEKEVSSILEGSYFAGLVPHTNASLGFKKLA